MISETERLILRPFRQSEAEDLYQYAKDPDVEVPLMHKTGIGYVSCLTGEAWCNQ